MSGLSRNGIFAVLLSLSSAVPTMAQAAGAIAGTVTDTSGAVVPGANVTLTNPQGSLGGNQTTVTNDRGGYAFIQLVPGTYVIKVDVQGFQPAEVQGIVVNTDTTARADIKLQVGAVQGEVTVTAATQMLDTASVQKITDLGNTELRELPNREDAWSAVKFLPGTMMAGSAQGSLQIDVGGNQGFQQSYLTARGTGENKYTINGADVTAPYTLAAEFYLDPTSYQEMEVRLGSADAEYTAGGTTINVVSRTGTDQLHGGLGSQGSTLGKYLATASNFTSQTRSNLLASVPASVLAANPDLKPTNSINQFTDFDAWIAGPIIKDKLWYAGTWHDQRLDYYQLGAYLLNGTEMMNDNVLINTTANLSYQINKWSQFTFFNNLQYKLQGHQGTGLGDDLARNYKIKWPNVYQWKYIATLGAHFAMDIMYSRWRTRDIIGKEPDVPVGAIPDIDSVLGTQTNAETVYNNLGHNRDVVRASGTYLRARHTLRFGLDFNHSFQQTKFWATSNIDANFVNGVANSVTTTTLPVTTSPAVNAPDISDQGLRYGTDLGLYIQDKYNVTRHLTLQLGLRYERNTEGQDHWCIAATQFFSGKCYPGLTGLPSPQNFLPRLGAIYDLKGDGKTALKFGFAEFDSPMLYNLASDELSITTYPSNSRTWTDLNHDGIPEVNELGPDPGYSVPAISTSPFTGNIKFPRTYEWTGGVQQQLPGQFVASATYVIRLGRDNIGTENSSIPTSAYTPETVTEAVTGKVVTVWLRDPSYAAAPTTNVSFNTPRLNTQYRGLELVLNRRMNRHFTLLAGATFQRVELHSSGGDLNNPTNRVFDGGTPIWNIPWSYRFSGVYQAPFGLMFSATFQADRGQGELTTVLVTNATIKFNPGQSATQVVNVAKNAVILPNLVQLDLSVEKRFRLTERLTFSPRVNIYNALNNATVGTWIGQLGSTYHRDTSIQIGRMFKFGGVFQF
jgi:hypothetical protein